MASDDRTGAPSRRDVIRAGVGAAVLSAIPSALLSSVSRYRLEPD